MSLTDSPLLVRADEVEELALGDAGLRLLVDGDAAETGSVNLCRSTMGRRRAPRTLSPLPRTPASTWCS